VPTVGPSPAPIGAQRYLQAAIDALSAVLAIVDETGRIVAVNRAWHSYAEVNGFAQPNHGVSTNYFEVCERSVGLPDAAAAAEGIKLVLRGIRESYQIEYASPAPREQRWFRMTVSRILDAGNVYAIVSHELQNEVVEARETIGFEDLIEEMSAAFVKGQVYEIDALIDVWLEKIARGLGIDRCTVLETSTPHRTFAVTHSWARDGVPTVEDDVNLRKSIPWLLSKILAGEMVIFSRLADLPPEAASDLEYGRRNGPKSNVTIPFKLGDSILGAATFGSFLRNECGPPDWSAA